MFYKCYRLYRNSCNIFLYLQRWQTSLFLDALIAHEWRLWWYSEVSWRIWVNLSKPSLPTIWDQHFLYKHRHKEFNWKNYLSKTYCVHSKGTMSVEIDLCGKLSQGSWKWPYICERSVWHFIMYWDNCSSALSADLWSMSQKVSTCQLWTLIALQWPHIMLNRWLSETKK